MEIKHIWYNQRATENGIYFAPDVEEIPILNGALNGFHWKSDGFGRLSTLGTYVNGKKHGKFRTWDNSGVLRSEIFYNMNVEDGPYIEYHDTAQVKKEGFCKDGKESGEWKYRDEQGVLMKRKNFLDGRLHGKQVRYEHGYPKFISNYKNGVLHGPWAIKDIPWEKNEEYRDYENGVLHGEHILYYLGDIEELTTYKNGKKNGPCKKYGFRAEVVLEEHWYQDDRLHGPYTLRHDKGGLAEQGSYLNGVLHGKVSKWTSGGKLSQELHYDNGRPIYML
jgi:antitoxin component YwqK of YwqJK toxin-antitoxin module